MNPKLLAFVMASVALVYVSRRSLLAPRSHGFYRFFAWEAILALIILNVENWFGNPFSLRQVVSWILLVASLYLVVRGVWLLHAFGKPNGLRDDAAIAGIEKTTVLVTAGLYKHIRHPLYSSLLFLAWGVFLKEISFLTGTLTLVATGFLVTTARAEEVENIKFFGDSYVSYMKGTKMFIPHLL